MTDTVVQLGSVQFADAEVPESIPFGGNQSLAVHELVGGARVVDAMGRSDITLEWSGIFLGAQASTRARALDALRIGGTEQILSWGEFTYRVVVQSFSGEYRRFYWVPYRISCTVVEDLTQPGAATAQTTLTDAVTGDVSSGSGLAAAVGSSPLASAYGSLSSAVAAVSDFASASNAQLQAVLTPLQAVHTEAETLLASAGGTIRNLTTVGGLFPNNPLATRASVLTSQVAAVSQQETLIRMDSLMGRVGINLNNRFTNAKSATVVGGNLFQMASQVYGDASRWVDVATASKLSDPQISGPTTLKFP